MRPLYAQKRKIGEAAADHGSYTLASNDIVVKLEEFGTPTSARASSGTDCRDYNGSSSSETRRSKAARRCAMSASHGRRRRPVGGDLTTSLNDWWKSALA
jgi:hypothetical protein